MHRIWMFCLAGWSVAASMGCGAGCSEDAENVASSVEMIRTARAAELTLRFDPFSDPELPRDTEAARAVYVLSLLEKARRVEPETLVRHAALFPTYGAHLQCLARLAATSDAEDCGARLVETPPDGSDVGALVQESLRLRMAQRLTHTAP